MNQTLLHSQLSSELEELKKKLDTLRSNLVPKFSDIVTPLENANGNLSNEELQGIYFYFEALYYEKIRRVHADIVSIFNRQFGSQDSIEQLPALSQVQDEMINFATGLIKQNQRVLFPESHTTASTVPECLQKFGIDYRKQLQDTTIEELAHFLQYLSAYIERREEEILAKIVGLADNLSFHKRQKALKVLDNQNP